MVSDMSRRLSLCGQHAFAAALANARSNPLTAARGGRGSKERICWKIDGGESMTPKNRKLLARLFVATREAHVDGAANVERDRLGGLVAREGGDWIVHPLVFELEIYPAGFHFSWPERAME